jgi:hypothetical protein
MTKKVIIIFSIIVICSVLYYGLFWLRYYLALEKSSEETKLSKCKDGIEEEFSGTIDRVNRYEYSDFMNKNFFALEILTTDSLDKFKTYHFNLKEYRDILDFANVGQRIKKIKGQDTFILNSDRGQERSFTIPDCRLVAD